MNCTQAIKVTESPVWYDTGVPVAPTLSREYEETSPLTSSPGPTSRTGGKTPAVNLYQVASAAVDAYNWTMDVTLWQVAEVDVERWNGTSKVPTGRVPDVVDATT